MVSQTRCADSAEAGTSEIVPNGGNVSGRVCINEVRMKDSDGRLIGRVLAGDLDAFGPLVARYQEAVYRLAWSIVGDFAAAEDVAQEAFIAAYRRLSQLRDPAAFPAWLRRIAVNSARMWLRKESSRQSTGEVDEVVRSAEGGARGFRGEIAAIVASLPAQKRQVAVLCYVNGVSRKEAARFLGISEVALRKRLHDAKRLLQRRIIQATERSLEAHILPRGFASRCVCGCKRALEKSTKEAVSMATKKSNCGCGCLAPKRTKARSRGKSKGGCLPR